MFLNSVAVICLVLHVCWVYSLDFGICFRFVYFGYDALDLLFCGLLVVLVNFGYFIVY